MLRKLNKLRLFSTLLVLIFTVSTGLVTAPAAFAMPDEGIHSFGEQLAPEADLIPQETVSSQENSSPTEVDVNNETTIEPFCGDTAEGDEAEHSCGGDEGTENTGGCGGNSGGCGGDEGTEHEGGCGGDEGTEHEDGCGGDGGTEHEGGCGGDEGTEHEDGCGGDGGTEHEGGCGGDEGTEHEGGCGEDDGTEHEGGCGGSGGSGGQGGPGNEDAVPPNKGPLKLRNFTLSGERIVTWGLSQMTDPVESTVLNIVQGSEGTAVYNVKAQKECRKVFAGNVTVEAKPGPGVTVQRVRVKLFKGETVIATVYLSESPIHFEQGITDYEINFELGPEEANQLPENINASIFFDGLDKGPQPRKKYISTSVGVPANRGDTTLTGELRLPGDGLELLWLKVDGQNISTDTSANVDGYVYAATVHKEIYKSSVFTVETGFRGVLTGDYSLSHMARLGENNPESAVINVHVCGPDHMPPKAGNDAFAIRGLSTRVLNVLANDTDYYGEGLTVIQAAYEEDTTGIVEISEDGRSLKYTPGGYGTDTFTYTVSDENGGSDTALVTVNVLRRSSGSSGDSGSGNPGDNSVGDGNDINSEQGSNEDVTGGQGEENGTGGVIVVPDTAGPAPELDSSQEDAFGAGNMGVNVSPRRVPAGDPTVSVSVAGAEQVYALLPDGRKLVLKEVKPGFWKNSFMVPFGTPDGPYDIRVIAVNAAGVESEANYSITVDNSLPLMQVDQEARDNGTYLLQVRPMFNAGKIYFEYAGGQPVEFIKKGGLWAAEVPDVSGQVVGVDESGYIVRYDVSLAELKADFVETAQSGSGWTGPDLVFRIAAVNGEVAAGGSGTNNTLPVAVLLGMVAAVLGVIFRKYRYN